MDEGARINELRTLEQVKAHFGLETSHRIVICDRNTRNSLERGRVCSHVTVRLVLAKVSLEMTVLR